MRKVFAICWFTKKKQLEREIFQLSKSFPKDEMFVLTGQIRRSSRSVGANLAEAWAKRRYEKHFLSKLTDVDGEQEETQHWIGTALDCEYITQQQATPFISRYEEVGRLLAIIMEKSNLFCGEPARILRESNAKYFVDSVSD